MSEDRIGKVVRKPSLRLYLAVLSAQMGGVSLGCALGWSGPSIEGMTKNGSEPYLEDNKHDNEIKTWIASSMALGALLGGLICGYIINLLGRKKTQILIGIPYSAGWILLGLGKLPWVLILGRVVTGVCTGIILGVLPFYVAEISTPNIRGLLGMAFNLFGVVGIIYLDILNLWIPWNYATFGAILPSALLSLSMFFMPESPNWLMSKFGRSLKVVEALHQLRHPDSDIEAELDEIEQQVVAQRGQSQRVTWTLLKRQDCYKPLLIAILMLFFQQFCGINAVQFYMTGILAKAGSTIDPAVAVIIINFVFIVATCVGGLMVDRLGRKILLIISGLGQSVSCAVFGYYYYSVDPNPSVIPIISLCIFVSAFSVGWSPVAWVVITEISGFKVISLVSSVSSCACWIFAFIVTKEFEDLSNAIYKYGAFWLFSGVSAVAVLFVFYLPETKGKTVEEIQRIMYPKVYNNDNVNSDNDKDHFPRNTITI